MKKGDGAKPDPDANKEKPSTTKPADATKPAGDSP